MYFETSQLCGVFFNNNQSFDCIAEKFLSELCSHYSDCKKLIIKEYLWKFLGKFKDRWNSSGRNKVRFEQRFEKWLNCELKIDLSSAGESSRGSSASGTQRKRGRPSKNYSECGKRAKKMKNNEIREKYCEEQLKDVVKNIKKTEQLPTVKRDEALALFLDMNLTKSSYIRMAKFNNKKLNVNWYPSYDSIRIAKTDCYPNDINVYDRGASVQLQSLLDHTTLRLLLNGERSFSENKELVLITKWRMDGSSGQQNYKQNFADYTSGSGDDSSIFIVALVPLMLRDKSNAHIEWVNESPSSTRYLHI